MKHLLIAIVILTSLMSCRSKQESTGADNPSSDKDLRTRYTFSQGMEADFSVSVGTYHILYDYSIPVDTFYQTAYPLGTDSILYMQLGLFNIMEDESVNYLHAGKKELTIYDGQRMHTINPPLFSKHMSDFNVKNHTLYYWGLTDNMYACTYNLKTKKHTQIELGPIVETDFDGVFGTPKFNDDGTFSFSLWDEENTTWTISADGKAVLSFNQSSKKFSNYIDYLRMLQHVEE